MPNVASVLREEIKRLSRKEIRQSTNRIKGKVIALSKTVSRQRKQVAGLEKEIAQLRKVVMAGKPAPIAAPAEALKKARLGPRSIRAQRNRLKLTQAEYAKLLCVSSPTILAWEKGKSTPRGEKLAALVGIRKVSPAEARQRLGIPPVARKKKKRKKGKRKKKK